MDDKQFEKRMELLKKSYDRLESQLNPEDVFAQIEVEEALPPVQTVATPPKHPSKWQKPAVWAASIASILLVGVLAAPYMLEFSTSSKPTKDIEMTPTGDYDAWLEELMKTYNEKRERMRVELDMPEDVFAKQEFVQLADSEVHYLRKEKEGIVAIQSSNSEFAESIAKSAIANLMTPRAIVESMEENNQGELLSFSDSYDRYDLYENKARGIADYYTEQLASYSNYIMGEPEQFPKELKELIVTANKQYIELQSGGQFRPNPMFGEHASPYKRNLHPDVLGYFKNLETGSLLIGGDLRFSASETADILMMYEQTLITDPATEGTDFAVLKGEYENAWLALFKGTIDFPMRLVDGQLNPEYMDFLARVADGEYGTAMQNTAQKIMSELKSGKSLTQMQLTEYDVWMGILQKRYDDADFTQNGATTVMLDDSWIQQAQLLHDTYIKTGDTKVIDTLQPLNVVSLFLYALSQEDYKTAQQLITSDVELSEMPKFNDMRIFSELTETNSSTISIKVAMKEQEHEQYGQKIIFKIVTVKIETSESAYRISAINK